MTMPRYAEDAIANQGQGFGGMFTGGNFGQALPGILQWMFGNSGDPFKKGGEAIRPYYDESKGYQNPFFEAGRGAIGNFQDWLGKMQNPSGFINNLMGQYQESPFAKFQQQQAMRAAQNMGSASGLTGSTPLMQQAEQNASNISSQNMNQWLQNVLGINTQYGAGQQSLMSGGQHAGDLLSQLAQMMGNYAGGAAYGESYGRNQDRNALFSGIGHLFGG